MYFIVLEIPMKTYFLCGLKVEVIINWFFLKDVLSGSDESRCLSLSITMSTYGI